MAAGSNLTPGWTWPPWCLNQKEGQLEVYVSDEPGNSRWVAGRVQTRILGPSGHDAYLQVLYIWDGEEYVEDFPPGAVRAVGSRQTVEEQIRVASIQAQQLAEVVLECVESEGIDPSKFPPEQNAMAFQAEGIYPSFLTAKIGRQHQPEFFERMVPVKENLTSISRTHFELNWESESPDNCPRIRQLSKNKLLVDGRMVTWTDRPTPVPDGACLSFVGGDKETCFLVLQVKLRCHAVVSAFGEHPAIAATVLGKAVGDTLPVTMLGDMQSAPKSVVAVLECVRTAGADLATVPVDLKAIPLIRGNSIEIGRSHQQQVFEQLLQAEPKYLSFVSRTHCRVHIEPIIGEGCGTFVLDDRTINSTTIKIGPNSYHHGKSGDIAIEVLSPTEFITVDGKARLQYKNDIWVATVLKDVGWAYPGQMFSFTRTKDETPNAAEVKRPVQILHVENLSMNVLFVSGRPLAKGEKTSIAEGGTVTFAAAVTGDESTNFLQFMFRRAKLVVDAMVLE